jgi:hypothetical protein
MEDPLQNPPLIVSAVKKLKDIADQPRAQVSSFQFPGDLGDRVLTVTETEDCGGRSIQTHYSFRQKQNVDLSNVVVPQSRFS